MPETELTGDVFLLSPDPAARPAVPPAANGPEARLVERVIAGDDAAFEEIYRRFAPMVHAIALSRLPGHEADDVVQDVFISFHKNLNALRDRNAVGPWLARAARNRCADQYRRSRPTDELTDEVSGPASNEREAREILAVIRSMPDAYRETLTMRLVEGLTGPEIAERTRMTHDSVRVNLHRGMKMLRERLGIEVK